MSLDLCLQDGVRLPPGTGSSNPILDVTFKSGRTYVLYDSVYPYTNSAQRRQFIMGGLLNIVDPLTRDFRACGREDGTFIEGADGRVFDLETELRDRANFIKYPYLLGVADGKLFGGIWGDGFARSSNGRVMVFHMRVEARFRNQGLGSELLDVYESFAIRRYDGLQCDFQLDEAHIGTSDFFSKNGYTVSKAADIYQYATAVKLFPRR